MGNKQKKKARQSHPFWKWLVRICAVLLGIAILIWIAFQVSPWPNSLLIRDEFTKGSEAFSREQEKYVPSSITQVENQQYKAGDKDAYLDVFYPNGTTKAQTTVVWVHGGGWVSGNKDQIDNYMKIFAGRGFTTVSVNYSIAPEKQYPTPIVQANEALKYLEQNADRLHIDKTQLFLAGDSAGSQIVAQLATIMTSPGYAQEIGIQPSVAASNLKGVLLNCGAYDLTLPNYKGPFGGFLRTVLWAYSGKKNFLDDPKLKPASVVNYVTADFPPTFITAGNVDPLLAQSTEFAKKLKSLNVPTDTLFYPADHQPQLNHEYQFHLDTPAAQIALEQMVTFVKLH